MQPLPLHNEKDQSALTSVMERNIEALARERRRAEAEKPHQERIADAITGFIGTMGFIYLHLALFGGWIVLNTGVVHALVPFDPYPFSLLSTCACIESIFLATFVLISQNRMKRITTRHSDLDLQVSLLSEHEITRLILRVDAIAQHMGVQGGKAHDLDDLKKDINPHSVLRKIDEELTASEKTRDEP